MEEHGSSMVSIGKKCKDKQKKIYMEAKMRNFFNNVSRLHFSSIV